MSGDAYPAEYEQYFLLYNRREYWQAHEVLEGLWQERGRDPFLQGLILLAAAGVHLQRDNRNGCRKVLGKAARRLAPWAPTCWGLDVSRILQHIERALATLAEIPAGARLQDFVPHLMISPAPVSPPPRPCSRRVGGL